MNQHLETLLNFVQHSNELSDDAKSNILKDIQKADGELLHKNRELEIEASLERVRTKAMSMRTPGDLINICEVLFAALRSLGFGELRNAMISTYKDNEDYLMDYDYSNTTGGNITKIPFHTHPSLEKFQQRIRSSPDAFADLVIGEEELNSWKAYRRSNGEPDDPRLENITSLYYYFYSIGVASIGISSFCPVSEQERDILKRFRNVFDLAYKRYTDIALAETQAREAQIELALERVRARTMAMQKSTELPEAANLLFLQMQTLGMPAWSAGYCTWDDNKQGITLWMSSEGVLQPPFHAPLTDDPSFIHMREAYERGESFHVEAVGGEELVTHYQYMRTLPVVGQILDSIIKEGHPLPTFQIFHCSYFSQGFLLFITYETVPEAHDIFKRFTRVFDQTYTRFLDLQKAEAQARESRIQLALERVRARTMAMQKSDELAETASLLFKQISDLGIETWTSGFNIWEENDTSFMGYNPTPDGGITSPYKIPSTEDSFFKKIYEAKKRGEDFLVFESAGESLADTYRYMKILPVVKDVLHGIEAAGFQLPTYQINHCPFFTQGFLLFITLEPYPAAHDIFIRFGKVFEQTYTRFLDLQKAEAQARESQIEAALERVRSRSMGMQKSEELKEVIKIVYQQLTYLKINLDHAGFVVDYTPGGDWHFWIADEQDIPSKITHPYFESVWASQFNEAKEKGADFFATNLNFEEKNKFYNELLSYVPGLPETSKDFYLNCPGLAASTVLLDNVGLYIENFSGTPLTDEENNTLMRFGKVFQQTYTRFLDLQKAEAQIREAKIEAALERTRTQSMLMQHSKELDDTLRVFHEQVLLLGIHSAFSFLWLPDEEKDRHIFWAAWAENISPVQLVNGNSTVFKSKAINYPLDKNEPATAQCLVDWKGDEPIVSYHVPPPGVENYFAAWQELIDGVEQLKPEYFSGGLYYVEAFMKYGCFGVMVATDLQEDEKRILGRFAIEFERTYRRFLDLQKAEAQAREAKIEAALERVRSRAMAMHKTDELLDAAELVSKELSALGISIMNVTYALIDEEEKYASYYSINPVDGKIAPFPFVFPHTETDVMRSILSSWKRQDPFNVLELDEEVTIKHQTWAGEHIQELIIKNNIDIPFSVEAFLAISPKTAVIYSFNYTNGYLFVIGEERLTGMQEEILLRFTKVFQMTYRRFLDIQQAEAQAREAQIEAALERVRSRTLAMQKSDELAETAAVLFKQLINMGIAPNRLFIGIIKDESGDIEAWATNEDGGKVETSFKLNAQKNESVKKMYVGWKEQKKSLTVDMEGKELEDYFHYLGEELHVPFKGGLTQKHRVQNIAFFSQGFIGMASPDLQPAETVDLLERFASVFNLTYARFNDLRVAEAHAEKAVIEEQKLREEKKRSDSLLLNILPEEVANELKQFGRSYARKHEEVTILFSDIKGFSSIAENLSAEELVTQLDECFRAFDKIIEKHGLEKIKTVGDAYICACGLPIPVDDNATKTIRAAIDMLDFLKGFNSSKKIQNLPAFEFRIGIHTGPVITGVVGLKKFTYDLWGDAVNMAARMEQHGEAGKINVSGNTYQLIKDKFKCNSRGKIPAKNKGEVDMYFVDCI